MIGRAGGFPGWQILMARDRGCTTSPILHPRRNFHWLHLRSRAKAPLSGRSSGPRTALRASIIRLLYCFIRTHPAPVHAGRWPVPWCPSRESGMVPYYLVSGTTLYLVVPGTLVPYDGAAAAGRGRRGHRGYQPYHRVRVRSSVSAKFRLSLSRPRVRGPRTRGRRRWQRPWRQGSCCVRATAGCRA